MNLTLLLSLLGVFALGLVHFFADKLYFLEGVSRSRWLSAAGGVAVAYVFVHLLPELNEAQKAFVEAGNGLLAFLENHVYLMALAGLSMFYGLEMMAVKSRRFLEDEERSTEHQVFWLHILSFGLYNSLIGYFLFQRSEQGLMELFLFTVAMLLHFLVNSFSLREHHKEMYRKRGRWILAGAVFSGWCIGLILELSEILLAVLLSFLAGGIILNVLKEELPEEKKSRFPAFALGAGIYTILLLVAEM